MSVPPTDPGTATADGTQSEPAVQQREGAGYVYENVGFLAVQQREGAGYVYENVGFLAVQQREGAGYVYENVIPLIDMGTIASAEDVPGPVVLVPTYLPVDSIDSAEAMGGPYVYEPRTVYLGSINDQPAVGAPWVAGPPVLSNAVQVVSLNGATGGTATLTFAGQTTAPIAWNATPAQIQAALEALPNIAPGDVVVT